MIRFIIYALHKFYCDYEHTEDEMTGNVARVSYIGIAQTILSDKPEIRGPLGNLGIV